MQHPYITEQFSAAERALLDEHVSNSDRPVFALHNLPEVVKGALFARYSRSAKSLRRLLVDEFASDLPTPGSDGGDGDLSAGSRAIALYERVFDQYGDDSVAQLGGAHVAVEQASNLLTKVLQWGRLAAYLEQSTRYVRYDDKPGGRYRYYRDPDIARSGLGERYTRDLDAVFDTYAALFNPVRTWVQTTFPQDNSTSDAAYRATVTAKVCDLLRGLLPAATVSNVGIFASGQSYEQLLLRLRGHELAEARQVGSWLLEELRTVIPSFLTRVDRPDRGEVWAHYLATVRRDTRAVAAQVLPRAPVAPADEVTLVAWSPDAETDLLTGMLYAATDLPEDQLRRHVEALGADDRRRVVAAYVGDRRNRRHKPGRALERIWYRFEICSDYGAFRDLQRHRMLTIEWQDLTPAHGYDTPAEILAAGVEDAWHAALERQAELHGVLHPVLPRQAQYAVGFAYRLRYTIQLNARAAMQMLELRTQPQGHVSYRRVCQRMHTLIRERAGHGLVADMMEFVDHSDGGLERLDAERAAEARRAGRAGAGQGAT